MQITQPGKIPQNQEARKNGLVSSFHNSFRKKRQQALGSGNLQKVNGTLAEARVAQGIFQLLCFLEDLQGLHIAMKRSGGRQRKDGGKGPQQVYIKSLTS